MPIDPSIALAVKSPTFNIQSPVDQFGQILSLRNLMQQQQMGGLDLQRQQLNLDQLRRQMQEQQEYADAVKAYAQRAGAAPAGAASAAQISPPSGGAPAAVPGAPLSALFNGGGASVNYGWSAQPDGSPALAAPPQPAPAAPVAPAMGAQGGSPYLLGMDAGQFIGKFPLTGMDRVKQALAMEQAQAEAGIKQHDLNFKKADAMGRYAQAVKASSDPAMQFTSSLMEAAANGDLDPAAARQMVADGYDKHKNDIDAFIALAQNGKDYADTQKTNLESLGTAQKNAGNTAGSFYDQPSYTNWLSNQDPRVQKTLGTNYYSGLQDVVRTWATPAADIPKTQAAQRANAVQILAPLAGLKDGGAAFNAKLKTFSPDIQAVYTGAGSSAEVMQRALDPEKYVQALHESQQSIIDATRVGIEQRKADMLYGPGTAESLAAQVRANPDTANDVPADMKARVIQVFRDTYKLPYPSPLKGQALDQETAAKNTLGDIDWIRNAMKNPNIANNVGPVLGRLQNVEQATGEASGLTGADAQIAQEFRTRMRFLLANEGGTMRMRINPKMMDDLAKSSGNIKMDAPMLLGALDGVAGYANNKINGFVRQRYGGQLPPVKMRAPDGSVQDIPGDQVDHYKSQGATVVGQ